jgi:hypothetical protein
MNGNLLIRLIMPLSLRDHLSVINSIELAIIDALLSTIQRFKIENRMQYQIIM